MFELDGRTALVTGGARGIGRAIAVQLAAQGADVCFSYQGNTEAAEATAAEITGLGRRAIPLRGDVTDPKVAEHLVKQTVDGFGRLDILVNNAGTTRDDLLMRMSLEDWNMVLTTNLSGAFYTTKAAIRTMLKARSGRIVNVSSASGLAGNAGQANYSAAKAGLIGLTKATAREVASRNITCNAVAPGFIETELTAGVPEAARQALLAATPLGRYGTPREVASAVVFLASDEAAFITGHVLTIDGGLVMM